MMKTYEGGCHCGRVRFRIEVDLDETPIGECNCSICTKKGILHLPVSRERLQILSGADELDHLSIQHRHREAHFLPALRHPRLL